MAKLKGIKKLNKVIANQLKAFGIEKAKLDDEFALYFEQNKVHYKLAYNEVDKWFNDCIKDIFDYEVEYTFIISLLHEIGHLNTIDGLTDKEYNKCLKAKEKIVKQLAEKITPEKEKQLNYTYFLLEDEYRATEWAINYAKKHPKKIRKMWHKILPAIMDFYAKNNVTETA